MRLLISSGLSLFGSPLSLGITSPKITAHKDRIRRCHSSFDSFWMVVRHLSESCARRFPSAGNSSVVASTNQAHGETRIAEPFPKLLYGHGYQS